LGRLDASAAMGVVFSILFAAGIVLLEQTRARTVHIDAEAVLYGQLEDILWLTPTSWASLAEIKVWGPPSQFTECPPQPAEFKI
jgi:manganese/zinc/iron transport system permease protein